jgi:hypothetical protein
MLFKVLSRIIDIISIFVNISIRLRWWGLVNRLVNLKKKHIAKSARKLVIKNL